MSQNDSSKNTGTTIKIAPKEASQRNSTGGADVGPGDSAAAPSVAPELVDIPDPPTPSQLVVKSVAGRTGPKSVIMSNLSHHSKSTSQLAKSSASASQMGPAASNRSAAREPTSSSKLTGPNLPQSSLSNANAGAKSKGPDSPQLGNRSGVSGLKSGGVSGGGGGGSSRIKSTSGNPASGTGLPKSATGGSPKSTSVAPRSATGGPGGPGGPASSPAGSSAVHDVDEEGEGEMEHPEEGGTPTTSPAAGGLSGLRGSSAVSGSNMSHSPVSDDPGLNKLSTRTGHGAGAGAQKSVKEVLLPDSPSAAGGTSTAASSSPASSAASASSAADSAANNKKKKVTKFRYHKRITVRTSGKTSPTAIMDKVNKKDHQAHITPSTIEDMDPAELMKRAGIKASNKTHWRVRLRQTKRVTKDGKTSTQTKVAYRDSEGNKRVKTSLSPYCKHCGKKLEECKCDTQS